MRVACFAVCAALFASFPAFAASECVVNEWAELGATTVRLPGDGGSVDFTGGDQLYGALRFDVEGSPVVLYGLRVDLADGAAFAPQRELVFGAGQWSREVNIPGKAQRAIDAIAFNYKSPGGGAGSAKIRLYGRQTIVLTGGGC